jgi:hypothetical protein
MGCKPITFPSGSTGMLCTRGARGPRCRTCQRPAVVLCDYPITNRRTFDLPFFRPHAKPIGEGIDYCVEHAQADSKIKREAQRA